MSCKTEEFSNPSSPVGNESLENTSCTDVVSQPCELSSSINTSAQLSVVTGTTTRSTRSASLKNKPISRKCAQTQMNIDIPGTSNTDHHVRIKHANYISFIYTVRQSYFAFKGLRRTIVFNINFFGF
jgi:hypothetical protein